MDVAAEARIPVLPVETAEFSADPDPFLIAARKEHPWLARFSQGYVVHGYQACADLMADDRNLICGFGPVNDPRVIILVKVDKPVHRQLGSEVAAPFFGTLARQIFDYLDVPPDNVRLAIENRKPKSESGN